MNEEIDVGDYIIVVSNTNGVIHHITHTMLRLSMGRPFYTKYKLMFNIIAFNKNTFTIDGACIVYKAQQFMIGLCTGKQEAIKKILSKIKLKSILVPKQIELDIGEKRENPILFGSMNQYILF